MEESVFNIEELCVAYKNGDIDAVMTMMYKYVHKWNKVLTYSCLNGYDDVAKFAINNGADNLDECFRFACAKGHLNVCALLITQKSMDLNQGLSIASQWGHIEIVKLLIEKGACCTESAICSASNCGHIEIVKFLVNEFKYGGCCINKCAILAYNNDHMNIVKLMIDYGANCWYLLTYNDKKDILNHGLNPALYMFDSDIEQLFDNRKTRIKGITKIADEVLYELYKTKQIYDINVISIITEYTEY